MGSGKGGSKRVNSNSALSDARILPKCCNVSRSPLISHYGEPIMVSMDKWKEHCDNEGSSDEYVGNYYLGKSGDVPPFLNEGLDAYILTETLRDVLANQILEVEHQPECLEKEIDYNDYSIVINDISIDLVHKEIDIPLSACRNINKWSVSDYARMIPSPHDQERSPIITINKLLYAASGGTPGRF